MKKVILLFTLSIILLLSACGSSGQLEAEDLQRQLNDLQAQLTETEARLEEAESRVREEISEENAAGGAQVDFGECCRMVYEAHCGRISELILYDFLSQEPEDIFADYDGSESQIVSYAESTEAWSSTFPAHAYYWKDTEGLASPESAAAVLVGMMLEEVREYPDKTFDLKDYSIEDAQLLDKYDLMFDDMRLVWGAALSEAEFRGTVISEEMLSTYVEQLFPRYIDGSYYCYCDSLAIALGDSMWVFSPRYSYSFEGVCNGYDSTELEEGGMIEVSHPDTRGQYFILIQNGDVWRMQSYNGIKMLDDALKSME